MSCLLETWACVLLLWSFDVLRIEQATADVIYPCSSMKWDWYRGVKPQNSSAPYVLNVTDQNGRSVHEDLYRGRCLTFADCRLQTADCKLKNSNDSDVINNISRVKLSQPRSQDSSWTLRPVHRR